MGWRMVLVAFCVDFVAVGFFFYSYGVFFKSIAADFGGSRLGVSVGLSITQAVGAFVAPVVGRALDRYPLRNVMGAGAMLMGTGFLALSQVQTQAQFYLVLGVFIGLGASSMGSLATSKLVTNWFDRRRGTALGIAAAGVSLSGVVMPYISAELIGSFGWRAGFLFYGGFTLLVVVPLVFVFQLRKNKIKMRPIQKVGSDKPIKLKIVTTLSKKESFLYPDHSPKGNVMNNMINYRYAQRTLLIIF